MTMEHKTTEMLAQEAEKLWGGIQGKTLTPKDRAAIPQQNSAFIIAYFIIIYGFLILFKLVVVERSHKIDNELFYSKRRFKNKMEM